MNLPDFTVQNLALVSWIWVQPSELTEVHQPTPSNSVNVASKQLDVLHPFRQILDQMQIKNAKFAHWVCRSIPAQCPFERDIVLFGHHLLHIPPLCKLNPLYEEVVGLRFRALCYLADECGEDVTPYC